MKLPLLGIAIVVFLQLGFTAYNALDRQIESLVYVKAVRTGSNPVAELSDVWADNGDSYVNLPARARAAKNDIVVSAASMRKARRPTNPAVVFANTVIKISAAKSLTPQLVAMQRPWESGAIRYPQPMRAGGESENYAIQAVRYSEKRSFAAKSVSVLKKPYDWIKAIGSKLK